MSGTHLYYNGVLMRGCTLKQYSTDILHDESDTDILYSKTTISVESLLISLVASASSQTRNQRGGFDAPWQSMAIRNLDIETVVDRWMEVQERLEENRKDFWMAFNGVTASPQPGRIEGDNGAPSKPPIPAADGYLNDSYRVVLAATGLTQEDLDKAAKAQDADQDIGFIEAFSDDPNKANKNKTKIERAKVIDLNNGPKPRNVRVEQVFGGRALRVNFTIEVCRCFCSSSPQSSAPPVHGSAKVKGVISNRWSLVESTDDQHRTSHHIDGKLVVADARYKTHAMKLMVHPQLFPYAKLQSRTFTTDRAGLALAYRFDIKEVGPAAPKGIVSWNGTYSERAAMGGKKSADLSVRVTGTAWPSNADANAADPDKEHKTYLLAMAYRIAQARIRHVFTPFNEMPGGEEKTLVVTDMYVVEHMAEPVIELKLNVLYSDLNTDAFGLRLKNMGASLKATIPGYDSKWWDIPPAHAWDTASEKIDAEKNKAGTYYDCYFQTPCSEWHATPQGAIVPDVLDRATGKPAVAPAPSKPGAAVVATGMDVLVDPNLTANLNDLNDPVPGQEFPGTVLGWNPEQVAFAYIQADIDTRYEFQTGKVQLPLSKERKVSQGSSVGRTSIVVGLHAGLARRTITMVASRIGKWPKVPEPVAMLSTGTIIEEYLDGEAVNDVPKLTKDGTTMVYSTQVRWVYGLSRLPQASQNDSLRAASSPMDRTKPQNNAIKLTDYFSKGEVEF